MLGIKHKFYIYIIHCNSRMKASLFLIFLFTSNLVKAQNQALISVDSLSSDVKAKSHLYVAPGYSLIQFAETGASFASIQVGLFLKERFDINISYAVILDEYKKQVIFPSSFNYNQKNIVIRGHYEFLDGEIRPLIGLGYQYSVLSWEPESDADGVFVDHINQYEIYTGVDWLISNTFSFQVNGGYKIASGVNLVGVDPDYYNGFFMSFLLRIKVLSF